ncbi:hypothetical protein [Methylocaldum sp. 14B]|jgi:hypothetical protein|uniref:hypothetical protein n=1 Tax=Methylocaldum sp. 14B TaxID=1912213 RepID=UPI00098B3DE1|nr:hypothetical protein [Methylocaldum sp. 14B]
MALETWLDDLLPTKWSRRLALATIAASGAAYSLPSFLPASYLPQSQEQVFLLRLVLLLLLALVGSLFTLALVAHAYHAQTKQHALELQKQKEHFESLATEEKKPHDNFTKPIKYDNRGIV